jgi:hypothetical protein
MNCVKTESDRIKCVDMSRESAGREAADGLPDENGDLNKCTSSFYRFDVDDNPVCGDDSMQQCSHLTIKVFLKSPGGRSAGQATFG